MLVKEKFHELIDHIKDEKVLEGYLNLILKLNAKENGKLYATLTEKQKEELDLSYADSFDKSKLLSNAEVKNQFAKWL